MHIYKLPRICAFKIETKYCTAFNTYNIEDQINFPGNTFKYKSNFYIGYRLRVQKGT